MMVEPRKKGPWKKRLLIAGLILVLIGAGIYWYIVTEKWQGTKDTKADFTVSAISFIREFQKDNNAANQKYSGKIITVNGRVSEVEAADTTLNIKFIDTTTGSLVIFAFQQQYLQEAKTLSVGDSASIKGSCSGGIYSELLEIEKIDFQRSTLNKN